MTAQGGAILRFSQFLLAAFTAASIGTMSLAMDAFSLRVDGQGNRSAFEKELRAVSVLAGLAGQDEISARDVLAAADADYTRLVEQLYGKGYFSGTVRIQLDGREAAGIDPFAGLQRVQNVQIVVAPGELFTFGQTKISRLPDGFVVPEGFQDGQPAAASVVRSTVADAVNAWRAQGYPKAQVSNQNVVADHARKVLLVEISIDPGAPATIGAATVSGESRVRPDRVRAIAGLPTGETYSPETVDKAAERLRSTGTFQSVRIIEADAVGDDGTLGLDLNVVDRMPRRIGGGVEYTNFDGISVSGYWLHRNFLRGAERFRAEAEVSQIASPASGVDYALSARLEKPAVLGPDTLAFGDGRMSYSDEPDFLIRKIEMSAGLTRQITPRLSGSLGVGLSYSEVNDRFAVPSTWRQLRLVTVPGSLTYDRRDNVLDTTSGVYLGANYTPFFELEQGQAGHHMTFDARGYRALGADARAVLAGRLQGGLLIGPDAQDAPPEFLFYSGGGGTVRGQPYQSLGANYGALTLGGRSFAAASGEVRVGVTDNISVVALADAGFVGPDDFSAGSWHAGAGLGLRYSTPVGPIRLDVAAPLAGTTGSGVQFYIGIGQAF